MNLIFVLILRLGDVHKLRLQNLAFFNPLSPPPPIPLHFLWYKSLQKVNFFDHLPPLSCKHSLEMEINKNW